MSDSLNKAGAVYLESSWDEYGYSQRNIADDVYDGVFKNIKITDMDDNELFSNELKNIEKVKYLIKNVSSSIINWFIKNL